MYVKHVYIVYMQLFYIPSLKKYVNTLLSNPEVKEEIKMENI